MAIQFTYGFKSDVPWADLTTEPDTDSAISIGQQLLAEGNHTVSEPTIVDDFTREWTLTFPDSDAWIRYKNAVLSSEVDSNQMATAANKGLEPYAVKTPDSDFT
tara:strand:+ start:5594 stop:5905 length:312 start_codon:yes stop_codon:yes gene_type:complete